MKKIIYSGVFTLLLAGVAFAPTIYAETTPTTVPTSMVEKIQALMAQLKSLQEQLAQLKGEIKTLKSDLREGMTDADIKKIQELLASDSAIYPEGKVTGYFGPLTKEALKRFQKRHGHNETGEIDEETRDLLEEYLHEGFGDRIPPGLLKAPGIMKKVEDRYRLGCDNSGHGKGMGPLCKKMKEMHGDDEDDEDDTATSTDDEDEDDDDTASSTDDGDGDEDEDEDTTTRKEARDAISDAEDAITDAEEAIDDASGDTDDAEALVADAKEKLEGAEDAFDDKDYEEAEDSADEAEDLAKDAEDAL